MNVPSRAGHEIDLGDHITSADVTSPKELYTRHTLKLSLAVRQHDCYFLGDDGERRPAQEWVHGMSEITSVQ